MDIQEETVIVPDIAAASAFYRSVFHAEIAGSASGAACAMTIGERRYRLESGAVAEPPHEAEVEDVDVCVARVATLGGRIIEPVSRGPSGRREGCVEDPFGRRWRLWTA